VDDRFLSSARELGHDRSLRSRVRSATLDLLARRRRQPEPGVRIVHYHYVFDDEVEGFRRQLEYLAGAFEAVSLSEAAARLETGRITGRELVVTFDDGFRNAATNAAPLLEAAGVRACFYLTTELVSAPRERAARICRERLHLPGPVEPLTWGDARELAQRGHEIGSHTRSHPDLTQLEEAEREAELAGSKAELEERVGPVRHFSAPYGEAHRFSPEVSEAARRAGYATCATAQRGLNRSAADLHALRRHHLVASWPVAHVRYFLTR
jgi:peptidoglycan/xylan/chitin deacetylase (PgdA/CDA1 family)